ncbi:MAG: response regulator, partial [Ahniella sp.]|nr:response regulator [Ahniella sp.]
MIRRCRVLLVDDQPIIHAALRQLLADCTDIELHSETDGTRALDQARALQPELILQDLQLDDVDGLDLLSAYRADPALMNVPVLVLSAGEEPVTKAEVFARGGNDYVVKLPSALELAARIRYHVTAFRAQRDREAAFIALLESRRVLEERNREIESRKQQLEQLNRDLAESAITDALTGLHNRRYLRAFLERPLRDAGESRSPGIERRHPLGDGMTLFLLDLDHFKH